MRPDEAGPKAKQAAEKALAIDPNDSDANLALGIESQWYEWNWPVAEREFKRAIELNPNSSEALGYYSWFLAPMGRGVEALAEARRGQQAAPLSSLGNFFVASVLVFTRQWDPAIEQLHSNIELDPDFWFDHCYLGRSYEAKGRDAVAEFQSALALDKENTEIWSGLGHAYASSGNRVEAHKVLDHLKELSANSYVAPYSVAIVYAGLGEKDEVFSWLDRAYRDRSYFLAVYLTTDSRLDGLHADPRFAELKRRVGLPE
jgi:tetratricopeptide (TPR) repeat protein